MFRDPRSFITRLVDAYFPILIVMTFDFFVWEMDRSFRRQYGIYYLQSGWSEAVPVLLSTSILVCAGLVMSTYVHTAWGRRVSRSTHATIRMGSDNS
jgi:purine-cytosine permease-like protein